LPPRTAAGALVAPPWDVLANASERAQHEPTVDDAVYPSQLLRVEVLRRPIESTLGAMVGVVDDATRLALGDGGVEGGEDQVGLEVACRRPADDPAAPDVDDHREEEEAGPGRDVGDVCDPELVRALGLELPLDEVGLRRRTVSRRRHAEASPGNASEAGLPHQPRDVADTDPAPVDVGELGADPRGTVGPVRHGMDLPDARGQLHVFEDAAARWSLAPGVVA
jgi:hypothetical protein